MDKKAIMDSLAREAFEKAGFAGAWLYAERGEIVSKGAVGINGAAGTEPIREDMVFDLASVSKGMFLGGQDTTIGGVPFDANIPSEECYTTPMRGKAEGLVYATKPLSYNGELIENFSVRFEGGKAVEVHTEKNQALLEQMIAMDEGAAYLGECALVPIDSPISESGLLFWNTLFDENAACHLALGMGFTNTIRGFEQKTLDECREMGVNDSMEHNDFMIGYDGLDIDAVTRDGKTVPIFRRGKWAF